MSTEVKVVMRDEKAYREKEKQKSGGEKGRKRYSETYRKLENHLTSCAVLFLLKRMSGKYALSTLDEG